MISGIDLKRSPPFSLQSIKIGLMESKCIVTIGYIILTHVMSRYEDIKVLTDPTWVISGWPDIIHGVKNKRFKNTSI